MTQGLQEAGAGDQGAEQDERGEPPQTAAPPNALRRPLDRGRW